MNTETFQYKDGSTVCIGYLACPGTPGPHPGILIAHEGPGLNDHARSRAKMIAELGYVALAADLYGNGQIGKSPDETMALMSPLRDDPPRLRARVRAGLDALANLPQVDEFRLGAIGYCFGGLAVLELARSGAPVAATVSFHGLLGTKNPDDARNIKGKILVCTGSDDPFVPVEQVQSFQQEMSQAGVDWQVITYGGAKHAFTNSAAALAGRPGLAYHAAADARSWEAMRAFLLEVLNPMQPSLIR